MTSEPELSAEDGRMEAKKPGGLCACGDHAWGVLTRGYVALVSPEDHNVLRRQSWSALVQRKKNFTLVYAAGTWEGRPARLHRLLMPEAPMVDHQNNNGLDCRRPNMRSATNRQNARNRRTSKGYLGVHRDRRRWRAQVTVDGRHVGLGSFGTPEEAARAYDVAASKHYGEFARLNFGGTNV